MSDNKKIRNEKWKGMSPEEFFKKLPRETFRMKMRRLWEKIKKIFFKDFGTTTTKTPIKNVESEQKKTVQNYRENLYTPVQVQEKTFDPTESHTRRIKEEAYLKESGFKRKDLVLTEEEYKRRVQEDAYFDSLPGYRKKDNERDER